MEYTVLGMPLDWQDTEGYTISPISALVIVRAIDSDGDEVYCVLHTNGLTQVDSLGMINFAKVHTENELKKTFNYAENKDESA